ncbi:MAG: Ldh family oxidoreductase [Salinirussus sp.]
MPRVDRPALKAFAAAIIAAEGAPDHIASPVADSLVTADLRGHISHGTRRLAGKYRREVENGRIVPDAEPEVTSDGPTWTQFDGNKGYGQLLGRVATEAAVEAAREQGVGVAALNGCSHIGRVGEFAEIAANEGTIFTAWVANPGSAWVAPAGSSQRRFSTNPIAAGVPTYDALPFPFTMDIATSQVAHGKITAAHARDDPIPETWAVDEDGTPLTDPAHFETDGAGAMLPLGGLSAGYKGTLLSVMSEMMAANISDGTVSGEEDLIWGNHAIFTAIDLESFTTRERAAERATVMADYIRSTDFSAEYGPGDAAKGETLLLPGEYEHRSEQDSLEHGIHIPAADARALTEVAAELGVDEDLVPTAFRGA